MNGDYEIIRKMTLDLSYPDDKSKAGNNKNLTSMQVYIQANYSSKASIRYHHQKKKQQNIAPTGNSLSTKVLLTHSLP